MNSGVAGVLVLSWLAFFTLVPFSSSISVGEDDYTSNFTTITRGGGNASASGINGLSAIDQFGYGITESGETKMRLGLMHLLAGPKPFYIYLESPANNSINTTDRTPDFTFNVSGSIVTDYNCSLWTNRTDIGTGTPVLNAYNSSTENGTSTTLTSQSLASGYYEWWVECTDNAQDTSNQSDKWNLSIQIPSINIYVDSPLNQSYSSQLVDLNITVSRDAFTCWWNLDQGTNHTMTGSGTDWDDVIDTGGDGLFHLLVYCNDTNGDLGYNNTIYFTVTTMQMKLTRLFWPDPLMAGENETVNVNTTVKVNRTVNDVYQINITDQIPWDFTPPQASKVTVYFFNYSAWEQTDITTNATVSIDILDQPGSLPTLLMVNITNISQTDAGGYLQENDSILLVYTMISSQMEAASYRLVYTNATVTDNTSQEKSDWLLENITAFQVVLRGYKTISIPDLSNPQNLSVEIIFTSMGGPTSGIYIADYLPDGANITDLNVTLYNSSEGAWVQLDNSSDYYIDLDSPLDHILPGGENVDVYHYNFSYACSNWDCNLYNNDTIRIEYNVSIIGGGTWILPTIIAGYDPTYKKHIRTEMHADMSVPLFDVELELITKILSPGDTLMALLKLLNVGGPKARVDVAATYSARSMQGELITEATDTFAVVEKKEKELSLDLPRDIKPGRYTFEAFVTYTGREAISTRVFEVTGEGAGVPGLGGSWLYILITVLALFLGFMYLRLGRRIGRVEQSRPG